MNNQFWLSTLVISLCLALSGCSSEQSTAQADNGQNTVNTPPIQTTEPTKNRQGVLGKVTAISGQEVTLALATQLNPDKIHVRPADDGTDKSIPPEPPTDGQRPDKQPPTTDQKPELDLELTGESKTVTIPADLSIKQGQTTGDYTLIKEGSILHLEYTSTDTEETLQNVTIME